MFCTNCGKEIPDTAKVCGYCGTKHAPISPAQPPKDPVAAAPPPRQVKDQKRSGLAAIPKWVMIGVGVILIGAVIALVFLNSAPQPQEITLWHWCEGDITAKAGTPIKLNYGFWGVTDDYLDLNNKHLNIEIRINGSLSEGKRSPNPIQTQALPCILEENSRDIVWKEGLWIFDTITIDPLPPGNYSLAVTGSLDANITDGIPDRDTGELIYYGPGQIYEYKFVLDVEE